MRARLLALAAIAASAAACALYARVEWPWVLLGWCALLPWLAVLDRSPTLASALGSGLLMCEAFVVAVFFWFAQAIATYTGAPPALGVLVLMLLAPLLQPQFLASPRRAIWCAAAVPGSGGCAHRRVRVCRCGVDLSEAVRRHPRARPAMSCRGRGSTLSRTMQSRHKLIRSCERKLECIWRFTVEQSCCRDFVQSSPLAPGYGPCGSNRQARAAASHSYIEQQCSTDGATEMFHPEEGRQLPGGKVMKAPPIGPKLLGLVATPEAAASTVIRKSRWTLLLLVALQLWVPVAKAQCDTTATCFCDAQGGISISQLVLAVNIALGVEACPGAPCALPTEWGSAGTGDGQFTYPNGLAVDGNGNVFVADSGNSRVQKFTNTGTFLTKWGSTGSSNGQFEFPQRVAVDTNGNVFVTDTAYEGNTRIQKFDNDGGFLTTWGSAGTGDGQFDGPIGLATDGIGNVFVADTNNNRIQKFDNAGTFLTAWGSTGSGDGEFNVPIDVTVDSSGDVYVADRDNSRIQKFTNTGTFLMKWGSPGSCSWNGQFDFPADVAADPSSGNIFVADGHSIQEFTNSGTFVRQWEGSGNGQFSYPIGVAVDGNGNVFVLDLTLCDGGARIQKFTRP